MRFPFSLSLPLAIALIAACSGDTSFAGPAPKLTVLGGNAASPAGVAHFEPLRSMGTPATEVARLNSGKGSPQSR